MPEFIDEELRAHVSRLIGSDNADLVETICLWVACAAIVTELARCGVVLPAEMRETVTSIAARLAR